MQYHLGSPGRTTAKKKTFIFLTNHGSWRHICRDPYFWNARHCYDGRP